ncbi:DUF1972 domain-containing protein, partial [Escherichia coli]|uniref:DUF1972 domain-containing protein n=1 Tax=Escherichia coli TaxID=562 RepID=UPI0015D88C19
MEANKMKTVAVVGTVGVPACYGGFESLVQNLVDYQSDDIQYQIFCSSKKYEKKMKNYKKAKLIYLPINANGAASIIYDIMCLIFCLFKKPDVTLILGVSGCLFLPIYKLFSKSKIIVNIDGLEWRRNKWGVFAKKFLKKSEAISIKLADVIISDNPHREETIPKREKKKSAEREYGGEKENKIRIGLLAKEKSTGERG